MHYLIFLVDKAGVQLPPQGHLLHHFRNSLFFLLRLPALRLEFVVFGPLLLFEQFESAAHFLSEAQFEIGLIIGVAECGLVDFLPVLLLREELVFLEGGGDHKAENVDFAGLVVEAD
jgi:hypothetical protein